MGGIRLVKKEKPLEDPVRIVTADDHSIWGIHYHAADETQVTSTAVLNCGAGIGARHYKHFARFLAASGVPVLTYDYRGIGSSKPPSLRGFQATIEDWSEHDCAAAIQWVQSHYPSSHVFGIGHSIGSLLFGGAANCDQLQGLLMIGAHTGYVGDYRKSYRFPMALLWHGAMPVLTTIFGYFPAKLMRLGDDIPKGVAMQWARRRKAGLATAKAGHAGDRTLMLLDRFARSTLSALIVTIEDDSFATETAAARVRELFPSQTFRQLRVSPAQAGQRRLGHFGFFRESASTLWPTVIDQLGIPGFGK